MKITNFPSGFDKVGVMLTLGGKEPGFFDFLQRTFIHISLVSQCLCEKKDGLSTVRSTECSLDIQHYSHVEKHGLVFWLLQSP